MTATTRQQPPHGHALGARVTVEAGAQRETLQVVLAALGVDRAGIWFATRGGRVSGPASQYRVK